MSSVFKIKQYDRKDIEKGIVSRPVPSSKLTVTEFLADQTIRDRIEWKLKYSMIRNWLWKRGKYSGMINGVGDEDQQDGKDEEDNSLNSIIQRIRKSIAEVVPDVTHMIGVQEDPSNSRYACRSKLRDGRLEAIRAMKELLEKMHREHFNFDDDRKNGNRLKEIEKLKQQQTSEESEQLINREYEKLEEAISQSKAIDASKYAPTTQTAISSLRELYKRQQEAKKAQTAKRQESTEEGSTAKRQTRASEGPKAPTKKELDTAKERLKKTLTDEYKKQIDLEITKIEKKINDTDGETKVMNLDEEGNNQQLQEYSNALKSIIDTLEESETDAGGIDGTYGIELKTFRIPSSLEPLVDVTNKNELIKLVKGELKIEDKTPLTYTSYMDFCKSILDKSLQEYKKALLTNEENYVSKLQAKYNTQVEIDHFIELLDREFEKQNTPVPEDKKRTLSSTEIEVAKETLKDYPEYGIMKKKLQVAQRMYETIVDMVGDLVYTDLSPFDNIQHTRDSVENGIRISLGSEEKKDSYRRCLQIADSRWENLKRTFADAQRKLKGRDEELNSVLHTIVAFSNNFKIARKSYLNYALLGPAGTGKTTLAKFIGELFAASGILITGTMREATRTDLIGQHLGETAPRTSAVLEATREGVLFLDEVYALTQCMDGAEQVSLQKKTKKTNECPKCAKWDPYGIEAVNTIVPFLSNNQGLIVVIVAGYTEDTWCTFFQANEGIPRRFPNVFILKSLSVLDLMNVFYSKLKEATGKNNITLTKRARKLLYSVIDTERNEYFNSGGGDIENLVKKVADVISNNEDNPDLQQQTPAVNTCLLKIGLDQYLWDKKGAKMDCGENCKCDERGQESDEKLPVDRLLDPRTDAKKLQEQKEELSRRLYEKVKRKLSEYEQEYDEIKRKLKRFERRPPETDEEEILEQRLAKKLDTAKRNIEKAKEVRKEIAQTSREERDEFNEELKKEIQEYIETSSKSPSVQVGGKRQRPSPEKVPFEEVKAESPKERESKSPKQLSQPEQPTQPDQVSQPEQVPQPEPMIEEERKDEQRKSPEPRPARPKSSTVKKRRTEKREDREEGKLENVDISELRWPDVSTPKSKDRIQRSKRDAESARKEAIRSALESGKPESEANLIGNNAYYQIFKSVEDAEKKKLSERRKQGATDEKQKTISRKPFSLKEFLSKFGIRYDKPSKQETPRTSFKKRSVVEPTTPSTPVEVKAFRLSPIPETPEQKRRSGQPEPMSE